MGTTPTSPKNIHPHASPSCSSLSPTFQIPNSKFQIRAPSSSPTFQIQATTDSLSHILFQEAPPRNTPDISVNILWSTDEYINFYVWKKYVWEFEKSTRFKKVFLNPDEENPAEFPLLEPIHFVSTGAQVL